MAENQIKLWKNEKSACGKYKCFLHFLYFFFFNLVYIDMLQSCENNKKKKWRNLHSDVKYSYNQMKKKEYTTDICIHWTRINIEMNANEIKS